MILPIQNVIGMPNGAMNLIRVPIPDVTMSEVSAWISEHVNIAQQRTGIRQRLVSCYSGPLTLWSQSSSK